MKGLWLGTATALVATVLAGAALAHVRDPDTAAVDWRAVATVEDRQRLREWRDAWVKALAEARADPAGAAVLSADPALFNPDQVIRGEMLKPGAYRCRTYRLGGNGAERLAGTAPPPRALLSGGWTACRVEGEGPKRQFATDGVQRASGVLFDSTDSRTIFLGTLALGDEARPMPYGRDLRRDMAGFVERIGEARWRLVLPFPGFQSTLDVMEIVPA